MKSYSQKVASHKKCGNFDSLKLVVPTSAPINLGVIQKPFKNAIQPCPLCWSDLVGKILLFRQHGSANLAKKVHFWAAFLNQIVTHL